MANRIWLSGLDPVLQSRKPGVMGAQRAAGQTVGDLMQVAALVTGSVALSPDQVIDHGGVQAWLTSLRPDEEDALTSRDVIMELWVDGRELEEALAEALRRQMIFSSLGNIRMKGRTRDARRRQFFRAHADRFGKGAWDVFLRRAERFPTRQVTDHAGALPFGARMEHLGLADVRVDTPSGSNERLQARLKSSLQQVRSRTEAYRAIEAAHWATESSRNELRAIADLANADRRSAQVSAATYWSPRLSGSIKADPATTELAQRLLRSLPALKELKGLEAGAPLLGWPAIVKLRGTPRWKALVNWSDTPGRRIEESLALRQKETAAILADSLGRLPRRDEKVKTWEWALSAVLVVTALPFPFAKGGLAATGALLKGLPFSERMRKHDYRKVIGAILDRNAAPMTRDGDP